MLFSSKMFLPGAYDVDSRSKHNISTNDQHVSAIADNTLFLLTANTKSTTNTSLGEDSI